MKRMRVIAQGETPNDSVHKTVGGVHSLQAEVYRNMSIIPGEDEIPEEYKAHWNYMSKVANMLEELISEGIALEEQLGLTSFGDD